ncbi:molecular chaperone DnaK [Hungatella hathewayi]|uniref:molecular chaperone DnaK n=1 Tax=Hungatella hathewayi TaxID=154046 RepID=UPI00356246E9
MGKVIGIDLGTTNSCVAVVEGGKPIVITNAEGQRITPSIVSFSKNGDILVGELAKRQAVANPERTISSIKRKMGTNYTVIIDGKTYTPQAISALILKKLKADAESYLSEPVTEAVITVPAYFDDAQRQATKEAGQLAGLDVKRVINEPTAAAVAYGLDNGKEQTIMVYDLGGGTFDVSIIKIEDEIMEVKATCGDTHLGGDDYDTAIANWIVSEFKRTEQIDLFADNMALQRIKEVAEIAKKELSFVNMTNINLPFIAIEASGPKNLDMNLSRSRFYELTSALINKTTVPVQNALSDAKLKPSDISKILLVGGSTRMISAQEKVKEIMKKAPNKELNPDECVALGAAIQGNKISGNSVGFDLLLLDVTPLSLSVGTNGGLATNVIKRNTSIPVRQTHICTTVNDGQTSIDIWVCQGERKFYKDNKELGCVTLDGLPPMRAGKTKVEITFSIDVNGILSVSAKELVTGITASATMVPSTMSQNEIDSQIFASTLYEKEDAEKEKAVEEMLKMQDVLNNTKYTLASVRGRIPFGKLTKINDIVKRAEDFLTETDCAIEADDYDTFKNIRKELMDEMEKIYNLLNKNSR